MDSVCTVIAASLNSLCSAEYLVAGSIKADLSLHIIQPSFLTQIGHTQRIQKNCYGVAKGKQPVIYTDLGLCHRQTNRVVGALYV